MNWMVTWIVITWFAVPCPNPPPIYDEYRGEIIQHNYTLEACYDTEEKPMQKMFKTYEEAKKFVDKGKEQCGNPEVYDGSYVVFGCDLRDFKIIRR